MGSKTGGVKTTEQAGRLSWSKSTSVVPGNRPMMDVEQRNLLKLAPEVTRMTLHSKPQDARTPSKVKGPILCHKCQLKCRDAAEYLSHKCKTPLAPDCLPFPGAAPSSGQTE